MDAKKAAENILVTLQADPNDFDIAITSINNTGIRGNLNQYVIERLGYHHSDLPDESKLAPGFFLLKREPLRSILFIVTVDGTTPTIALLRQNLSKAITELSTIFYEKNVWLPLMGTGEGGLSFDESYGATYNILTSLSAQSNSTQFYISIPNNKDGIALFEDVIDWKTIPSPDIYDAEEFVDRLNTNFYAVGTVWADEGEQINEFYKNDTWITGYTEKWTEIINGVLPNDILIAKSSYTKSGQGVFRIKAVGRVISNPKDGRQLIVDWKLKNIWADIVGENLSKFRSTIAYLGHDDVVRIFSAIHPEVRNSLLDLQPTKSTTSKIIIPGLLSDSDNGDDLLDIKKDIDAFAKVMTARSFSPPLAIALFGKWGSGKSFFMNKLKSRIEQLSSHKQNNIYCKGVAQIHFNAWSYMDTNLWASFTTKIFQSLNEYITQNTVSSEAKKYVETHLSYNLTISKEEIATLEKKENEIQKTLIDLNRKEEELSTDLRRRINVIQRKTVFKVIDKVNQQFNVEEKLQEALNKNDSYVATIDEIRKIIPESYWHDPNVAYQNARSKYTFLKEFLSKKNILRNALWLIIILIIILVTPALLYASKMKISEMDFTLPQSLLVTLTILSAIYVKAERAYYKLRPIIIAFWQVKEEHGKQIADAISRFEQEEKALKLEIENKSSELAIVINQIQETKIQKADFEFKINNMLSTEALRSFIEKRAGSDDYKKHLGIISIVRKDFEILNELFVGHNKENQVNENAIIFKEKFKTPLERIILYIDDLDRCPEENVVQVLEAVNLLMAFPLFIVVVGVDPRWVKNALIKKHHLQFSGQINGFEYNTIEIIDPSNYLEKIFQIPFCLKDANQESIKGMIRNLSKPATSLSTTANILSDGKIELKISNDSTNDLENVEIPIGEILSNLGNPAVTKEPNVTNIDAQVAETLILSDLEVSFLEDMSIVIGNNPRTIKRFVNTYRIIKAHEDFDYDTNTEEIELLSVMFLLALSIGKYKLLEDSFLYYSKMRSGNSFTLANYLQSSYIDLLGNTKKQQDINDLKHELDVELSDHPTYVRMQGITFNYFEKHSPFVKRFTFNN